MFMACSTPTQVDMFRECHRMSFGRDGMDLIRLHLMPRIAPILLHATIQL